MCAKVLFLTGLLLGSIPLLAGEYFVLNKTSPSGTAYYVELFYDGATPNSVEDDKSLGEAIVGLDTPGVDIGQFQIAEIVEVDGVLLFVIIVQGHPTPNFFSWVTSTDLELNKDVVGQTSHTISRPQQVRMPGKQSQDRIVSPVFLKWNLFKGNSAVQAHRVPPIFYIRRGEPVAVYAITRDWYRGKSFSVYRWDLNDVMWSPFSFIDLSMLPRGEYDLMIAVSNGDLIGARYANVEYALSPADK